MKTVFITLERTYARGSSGDKPANSVNSETHSGEKTDNAHLFIRTDDYPGTENHAPNANCAPVTSGR
jgi:hypothetical protein